jgi:hypothetical protein
MTKRSFSSTLSTSRAIRSFGVRSLLIMLCLWVFIGAPAFAVDGDASNPIALSNNEVSGKEEPKGQSRFYSFSAGPGDINIKVNGATDFYSTTMRVVLRDTNSRELANISFPAISDESTKTATVHLATKQNLVMQVMFSVDVGVHVNYKVQLDGSAFSQNGMLASTPPAPAAAPQIAAAASRDAFITSSDAKTTTIQIKDTPVKSDDNVNKPIDDKWALIVGISKFQKPEVNLKYPAKDAADLRDFLVKEANFAPDHVKLLVDENATKVNVMAEIGDKWLPRVAHPNDLVLIFISTHGSPSNVDLQGLNYLVMHDTDPSSLYATGLPLQDLAAAIKQRVHANRVVLVVDACHSGAANPAKGLTRIGNFDSDSLLLGTGQLIICSSEPSQVSWESKRYENGVFTHQLIQALREKGGKVPLAEAFEKLKDSVVSEVLKDRGELQSPVMKTHWSGKDLILSAPPARPH